MATYLACTPVMARWIWSPCLDCSPEPARQGSTVVESYPSTAYRVSGSLTAELPGLSKEPEPISCGQSVHGAPKRGPRPLIADRHEYEGRGNRREGRAAEGKAAVGMMSSWRGSELRVSNLSRHGLRHNPSKLVYYAVLYSTLQFRTHQQSKHEPSHWPCNCLWARRTSCSLVCPAHEQAASGTLAQSVTTHCRPTVCSDVQLSACVRTEPSLPAGTRDDCDVLGLGQPQAFRDRPRVPSTSRP